MRHELRDIKQILESLFVILHRNDSKPGLLGGLKVVSSSIHT